MIVPNRFPTQHSTRKICVIGEAPGADEVANGRPFVGMSGRFLAALMSRAGVSLDSCFLGNISQHRPPNNDFSTFSWNGIEIQHGLEQLANDLATFQPNIVILCGNIALKAAKDCYNPHPLKPNSFKFKTSNWRGSLFLGEAGPFHGLKCINTWHPAFCLRDHDNTPFLQFDLRKAVKESATRDLILPKRDFTIARSRDEAIDLIRSIRGRNLKTGTDIEGYWNAISCIAFAETPWKAFLIPFVRNNGQPVWHQHEEPFIWRELATALEDPTLGKIWQNGLYDRFCLQYGYGIRVQGNQEDIMLKHWSLYSELGQDDNRRKGKRGLALSIQASIYTNEPYWKSERESDDDEISWAYCCKDAAVTKEIDERLDGIFSYTGGSGQGFTMTELTSMVTHYRKNHNMLNPVLYMELRGMRYNIDGAKKRKDELNRQKFALQAKFNALIGMGFDWTSKDKIFHRARELMGRKKADIAGFTELKFYTTKPYIDSAHRLEQLMHEPNPDLSTIGEVEDLCEVSLNLDSSPQVQDLFYNRLGMPVQMTNKKGEEPRPTCDYEAMLNLVRKLSAGSAIDPRLQLVHLAMEVVSLGTRQQMLGISADRDGRIRCGYNIVGSNTGRMSCYKSPTGSGYNLTTIPNYTEKKDAPGGILGDRDLFLSDEDYWFFQCDLKGSDGWTVAAYCAMLGDDTMLEDYKFGLKPANVLTLFLRGLANEQTSREDLKQISKQISKDSWDYFAMKRTQHGVSYLESALTVSRSILKDSEGKMYLPVPECEKMKQVMLRRYWGIPKWHDWMARRLKERPVLRAASGQVRQFFGRPDEILTKAVAFEPQANTTYATNLAMYKLWTDKENRVNPLPPKWGDNNGQPQRGTNIETNRVALRIEPLHQVHDALCGQFRKEDTAWSIGKINQWFDNSMTIAGQQITIPFDGGYGSSWGSLNEGKI